MAVQAARNTIAFDSKITAALNDAANTLAAIKLLLSVDIGEEFDKFTMHSNRANGQDLVDFLRERGLPINK